MNILYEIGLEGKGTLMMIPANTLTAGVSNFGISEDKDFEHYINERRSIFKDHPLNKMEEGFMDRFRQVQYPCHWHSVHL